tara:strand:+ start:1302 stop:1532 length:231 start_codon:yes stop_codon:yes gene_type:complete
MVKKQKKQSLEIMIGKIESIVEKLESGDLSLEKSMKIFEEGVSMIQTCRKDLEQAELKVNELILKNQKNDVLKDVE